MGTLKEGLDNIRKLILDPHDIVRKFVSLAETSILLDHMAYTAGVTYQSATHLGLARSHRRRYWMGESTPAL